MRLEDDRPREHLLVEPRPPLTTRTRPERAPHRKDIQGLRALAVLAVVGDHVLQKPSGGFVGVDVFFVISGFLITGLLVREHARTGRIDLADFYRRRIKRTLPVAWVVLAVTLGAAPLLLSDYALNQLVPGAVAAGGFFSNWHLIALGTDYLHATDVPTAVQHYWSLAVEEQFYLVWPVLLIAALFLIRVHRRLPMVVLTLLVGASVVWSIVQTSAEPTAAYFSTFSRGWELLVGAALAMSTPMLFRIPAALRPPTAWFGLAVILGGLAVITPDSAFPMPWALVPVLGTALVIAAGTGADRSLIGLLAVRPMQLLGKASYSVYLWHFPVTVFTRVLHPETGRAIEVLEIALIGLLSVLSYRCIEVPLRHARWRRPRWPHVEAAAARRACAGLLVAVLLAASILFWPRGAAVAAAPVDVSGYFHGPGSAAQVARSAAIEEALRAERWPASLVPAADVLGKGAYVSEWIRDGCLDGYDPAQPADRCVYGDPAARRTAVLYGDSIAISFAPALRAALSTGWRIEVMALGQCPAVDISALTDDGSANPSCDSFHRSAIARLERERPDLTVMVSSHKTIGRVAGADSIEAAEGLWREATARTLRRIAAASGRVVAMDSPPVEKSVQTCRTPNSSPSDCEATVDHEWARAAESLRKAASEDELPNVSVVSTLPWFCDAEGRCPALAGNAVVLADGMHLTSPGSLALGPLMRQVLRGS